MPVTRSQSKQRKVEHSISQEMIAFKTSPFLVIWYALVYTSKLMLRYSHILVLIVAFSAMIYVIESDFVDHLKFNIFWCLLGIASSIGFGSGLHTFLIYLGPHVVHLTHYAQKCGLPNDASYRLYKQLSMPCNRSSSVSFMDVYMAVAVNAFCWGVGTAIGELPPYFIARTDHKASEEVQMIQKLSKKKQLTTSEQLKVSFYKLMKHYGFLGILLCASVPNPFFDFAGMLSGHYMIPFLTFFSATFIGKALIKAGMQTMLVIGLFRDESLQYLLKIVKQTVPGLHSMLSELLETQKAKFDRQVGEVGEEETSWFSLIWGYMVLLMILYFVVGFLETLANWELASRQKSE